MASPPRPPVHLQPCNPQSRPADPSGKGTDRPTYGMPAENDNTLRWVVLVQAAAPVLPANLATWHRVRKDWEQLHLQEQRQDICIEQFL